MGRYELCTEPVENNKGVCEWYQSLQLKSNFNCPADPNDVPDLVIHLMAVSPSVDLGLPRVGGGSCAYHAGFGMLLCFGTRDT